MLPDTLSRSGWVVLGLLAAACAPGNGGARGPSTANGGSVPPPTAPSCAPTTTGGSSNVTKPELAFVLKDRWQEAWLGAAAVADLDGDGKPEIIVPREGKLIAWHADGSIVWSYSTGESRIWASPVVADFLGDQKLEVAVAARDTVVLLDSMGKPVPGFPVKWTSELRSLSAADVDGDGQLDLLSAPGRSGATDVIAAWHADGGVVPGFPPMATGSSKCDDKCYFAGCYDQNVASYDLDGDGKSDVVVPHDNAYASFFKGTGEMFDAHPMYNRKKVAGVRYLHKQAEAIAGYAEDEATALQAHFTNTAPAIGDLDGDGKADIVMLGSVQNAAQDQRKLGVALWAVRPDGSRLSGWEEPFHVKAYLAGLEDLGDTNVVGATNQATIADIDPASVGPELIFAGFDGFLYAVSASKKQLWRFQYTTRNDELTGGAVVADLSGDGIPEVVFTSYSTTENVSALFVLDAGGNLLHRVALPRRGAMPLPTIADADGDGTLDIVVSLKDAVDKEESVRVYRVASGQGNCLLWPTARGNLLRNGAVPPKK